MHLPPDLQHALDEDLASVNPSQLTSVVTSLSDRYRSGPSSRAAYVQTKEESQAYAAFRMPATFGSVYAALRQVSAAVPERNYQTLMDVGAGPGTAMWAAVTVWPTLKEVSLYEKEPEMISLGRRLTAYSDHPAIRNASWHRVDLASIASASTDPPPLHDIIIASYVIGELSDDVRDRLIHRLWTMTRDTLIIIEPGTPDGFSRIKQVRHTLLSKGAHMVAPCPHHGVCPLGDDDWCHFAQRVHRSKLHRHVKGGDLSYEDEKFSFVSVSRTPGAHLADRVLRHPQIRKGHIGLQLCTSDGIERQVVTRKDREQFRIARKLKWGSSL